MMMENDEARIRNHSHSIYSLFATKLHQAQKIGNYIKGYIDGKDCLDQFLKEYCDASNTKYIVRSSNKKSREFHFSKRNISDEDGANGTRYGHTERIYWEFNNRNLYVPFTGTPFVVHSSQIKQCQYGVQYYKQKLSKNKTKQLAGLADCTAVSHWSVTTNSDWTVSSSRRRHLKPTRKRNCPAYLNIREIILFLDFAVQPEMLSASKQALQNEKATLLNNLREALNPSTLKTVHRFYVEIPLPEAHSNHPFDPSLSPICSMNPTIKAKLDELLMFGRYEKKYIQLIIQDHIKEASLQNSMTGHQVEAFPTEEEINDYIYLYRISAPTVVEVHTKEYVSPDNSEVLQTSTQKDMEKSLEELKTVLQSCSDKDVLWDVKIRIKKMIQKLRSTNKPRKSTGVLGKRNYSSLNQQQLQRVPVDAQQQISSYAYNENERSLTLPQPDAELRNHAEFRTTDSNSVLPQPDTQMYVSPSDNMSTFNNRFLESNQNILPLVDQVFVDSSYVRSAPTGNFSYFSQYSNS